MGCSVPLVDGRADVRSATGTANPQKMAEYRGWHEGKGLRVLRCPWHAHSNTAICYSVESACTDEPCTVHRHICNGVCTLLP